MQRNVYPNIETLSQGFADYAETTLRNTLIQKPKATLAVPGGNTPRFYLPVLAKCPLPWEQITVTLSDERWVAVTDEQSNEHLVKQHLMNHLPATTRFVGLKTQQDNPFSAVDEIHQRLDNLPLPLSLTVLGLGEDGHIASLFPGMNSDLLSAHHCVAVAPPIAPSLRISLSLAMLAKSENIALIVTSEGKRKKLNEVLSKLEHLDKKEVPLAGLLQQSRSLITVFEIAISQID